MCLGWLSGGSSVRGRMLLGGPGGCLRRALCRRVAGGAAGGWRPELGQGHGVSRVRADRLQATVSEGRTTVALDHSTSVMHDSSLTRTTFASARADMRGKSSTASGAAPPRGPHPRHPRLDRRPAVQNADRRRDRPHQARVLLAAQRAPVVRSGSESGSTKHASPVSVPRRLYGLEDLLRGHTRRARQLGLLRVVATRAPEAAIAIRRSGLWAEPTLPARVPEERLAPARAPGRACGAPPGGAADAR